MDRHSDGLTGRKGRVGDRQGRTGWAGDRQGIQAGRKIDRQIDWRAVRQTDRCPERLG